MVAAALLLCGCGAGEPDARKPGRTPTASASEAAAATTSATVEADIRAGMAAGGFDEPRFTRSGANGESAPCVRTALVSTAEDPDPKDTARLAAEMKRRGWSQTMFWTEDGMQMLSLRKTPWTLDVGGATISKDQLTTPQGEMPEDFTGLVLSVADRDCLDRTYARLRS
ncbi:hypothetical protein [Streptomyces pseudogriseolus]|uniref:hypothetical protein n=1 Tax=Streptomyces pseudogriseolus TaxID=36817 RepID=UPI003491D4D0|nr:hypothetical protein [Streptomyces pseudogriseolus]